MARRDSEPSRAGRACATRAARVLLFAVALGGSACQYAATDGASVPAADMATLQVIDYRQDGAVWNAVVRDVDGKRPPWLFRETQEARTSLGGGSTGPGKAIQLAPGEHALRVGIYWDEFPSSSKGNPFNGSCTLVFAAAPGGFYQLQSNYWRTDDGFGFGSRHWSAQIVDARTQEVVNQGGCQPLGDDWVGGPGF